ncbi:NFYB/HAP3 family transcription factor subunit [bacterium]|nr:NFYB/HAP3 family transcription factor subunit [bacterium]
MGHFFCGIFVRRALDATTTTQQRNNMSGKKLATRRSTRKRQNNYKTFIYRVLKQVQPNRGISTAAMTVMNDFVNDVFRRICDEAKTLRGNRKTLSSRDVQAATRLILRGEIAKHAVSEATVAMRRFERADQ